jgi:hypothetical protein
MHDPRDDQPDRHYGLQQDSLHEPPLPELRTGLLDDASAGALFRDIAALTQVDEVIVKHIPGRIQQAQPVTLEQALRLLLAAEVRAVQIRYRHDGACWLDTLMRSPEGLRLVRVRHDRDEGREMRR